MQKVIEVKNGMLSFIVSQLSNQTLDIKESSVRRRFLKPLIELNTDYQDEAKNLVMKYVDRDLQNKPIIENNQYMITDKGRKRKFSDESKVLIAIDNTIVVDASNEKDLSVVVKILEGIKSKFVESKKDQLFNASDYEQISSLEEVLEALSVKEK